MRYEEQLLMDLKAEIMDRAERRRRLTRRLFAGGAAVLVAGAAAVAIPVLTGTGTPAYAVNKKADGTVNVQIHEFKDVDQLERDLNAAGVRADVSYLPPGKQCEKGRGKVGGKAMGPGADAAARIVKGGLDIDPLLIGQDQTLLLEFTGDQEETAETKKYEMLWRLTASLVTGQVGPCVPVDDPTWEGRVAN
ncbi:hypothetical protein ACFYY8_29120 [Streptosporangium sp. NPDC001559]|uniref:hypothetical protein n=1 Tax=Streptosporangium sp. NPDC001559 TaxID=3366187 RepID=UPI0036E6C123